MLTRVAAGLAGAIAVTAVHESARQVVPHAPRIDEIGSRANDRLADLLGVSGPGPALRYALAIASDLSSNGLLYALVPGRTRAATVRRGVVVGLICGGSALLLPGPLGLGKQPGQRTPWTQVMTVLLYLIGGAAAATVGVEADG